jgi:hypothetical protein
MAQPDLAAPPLQIGEGDETVWINVDPATGQLVRVDGPRAAVAGLRVVPRRLSPALVLLARNDGILVDGLPALPLTVLATKDGLVVGPGCLVHVTERVRPHVGPPGEDLLGKKCPFCKIAIDADTRVVTCRCKAAYHHETKESHPHEKEPLTCFEKVQACLVCGRPLTTESYLTWNPATL